MKKMISIIVLCMFLVSGCGTTSVSQDAQVQDFAHIYAVIDLHLHLDGSISLESARELAEIQGIIIPESDDELRRQLQVSENCSDLNEYLEKFAFPCSLLQTPEGIRTAVYNLEEELKSQGLLYAEIRFAPQKHMENGLSQAEVVEAAIEGMNQSDFCSNLILCCMRGDDNQKDNLETVRVAAEYLEQGVCAVDLAGAEALYPTESFGDIFEYATNLKVPYTIHAGEADGPSSVYQALEFDAKRIGHGVRSAEDEQLLQTLVSRGIVLELCPTSNLNTNIYESISEYPIRTLLEEGVKVTLNTDNMTVSNTTLEEEYRKIIETFDLTEKEVYRIVENAIEGSFANEDVKNWLREELQNNKN